MCYTGPILRLVVIAVVVLASNLPAHADRNSSERRVRRVEKWPAAVVLRPLTLPQGWYGMRSWFAWSEDEDGRHESVWLDARVGVTDRLELFGRYAQDWAEAGLAVGMMRGPVALALVGSTALADRPFVGGLQLRWRVSEQLALSLPPSQVAVLRPEDEAGDTSTKLVVRLPVAFGLQATPRLYLSQAMVLARVPLTGGGRDYFVVDHLVLQSSASFNVGGGLDLTASYVVDPFDQPRDDWTLLVSARAAIGLR